MSKMVNIEWKVNGTSQHNFVILNTLIRIARRRDVARSIATYMDRFTTRGIERLRVIYDGCDLYTTGVEKITPNKVAIRERGAVVNREDRDAPRTRHIEKKSQVC